MYHVPKCTNTRRFPRVCVEVFPNFFLEDVLLPQRSLTLMLAGPAELLESGPLVHTHPQKPCK
jgi:hypothetical protein